MCLWCPSCSWSLWLLTSFQPPLNRQPLFVKIAKSQMDPLHCLSISHFSPWYQSLPSSCHKHTEVKQVILSIIPCIDSNLSAFVALVEFTDVTLSGFDLGPDSLAWGGITSWLTGGLVGGGLVESLTGPGAAGAFSVDVLALTILMWQKSFPLELMWQVNSPCIRLSPNRVLTNGTTTTSSWWTWSHVQIPLVQDSL